MEDKNRIKVKEAYAYAKQNGYNVGSKELACRVILHARSPETAYVTHNNYVNGFHTSMTPERVQQYSKELKVDANFLFDVPPMKSDKEKELEGVISQLTQENTRLRTEILTHKNQSNE
jgi:queuine/archaeosine tRNA-ribosyltransferase